MVVNVLTPYDLTKFSHLYPDYILSKIPADALLIGCISEDPLDAAGILMAHVEEGEIIIDWLYVDEPYRRQHGATDMVSVLLTAAEEFGELEGVNVLFSETDENLWEFFRSMDFITTYRGGDKGFYTELGKIPKLPVMDEITGELCSLSEVPEKEIERFMNLLNGSVIPGGFYDPYKQDVYLPESSVILVDGLIRGICLVRNLDDGLDIAWLYNYTNNPNAFPALINACVNKLKESYPENTPFTFASTSPKMDQFIESVIPVDYSIEMYIASYPFVL